MIDRASVNFIRQMTYAYGVISCFDSVDEEMNTLEDEGLWFECPFCHEVIRNQVIVKLCPFCNKNFL